MNSGYPSPTPEIARKRRALAPAQQAAFDAFGKAVFADGTLSTKIKQIIAVAVATRARVSHFMNKFRNLGCIDYKGDITVHRSLSSLILHEQPP
jgi:alkylhydroperoxidase/carboxymuconolactone decarboxylase family protein YurZ